MTTPIGQPSFIERLGQGIGGSAQSPRGPQIPLSVQGVIGSSLPATETPSLINRITAQCAAEVQPPIDSQVLADINRQGAWAFLFDNPRLRDNHTIVLAAINKNRDAIIYASETLQANPTPAIRELLAFAPQA